jgi:predicted nucleotidyltransferase
MKTLFKTVVGAHIWHMEHEGSDTDIFECYQTPTIDLLRGKGGIRSFFEPHQTGNRDIAQHELQTVVNQLLKGNLNFVLGVMSPIRECSSDTHIQLIDLFLKHPPKNLYHSLRGMAIHNVKLYQDELDYRTKKVNTILRILRLGIAYLTSGDLKFEPYYGTRSEIDSNIKALDEAYKVSALEEKLPEDKLRNILYNARIKDLNEENDCSYICDKYEP